MSPTVSETRGFLVFMQVGVSPLFGFKSGSQSEVRGWEERKLKLPYETLNAASASLIHTA